MYLWRRHHLLLLQLLQDENGGQVQ